MAKASHIYHNRRRVGNQYTYKVWQRVSLFFWNMTTSNQFQEWRADGQRLGQASSQATCCCCCQIRTDQSSWASDAQVLLLGDQPLGMTLSTQNGSWISTPIVTSLPLPFTKWRVNFLKGVINPRYSLLPAVSNDCQGFSHYLVH